MALKMALKADFHMHTKDDPQDYKFVKHSCEELINHAQKKGFEVLSITGHNKIIYSPYLREYAANRGILLIPGAEVTIEGKHILLINYLGPLDFKTFTDLERVKRPETLIVAAHPFFPGSTTLKGKLKEHLDLFDAIEYCHFYHHFINFNRKAKILAEKYKKPLVGTSDTHFLMQMDSTYSIVEVTRKTPGGVVEAIKAGEVRVVSRPLSVWKILKILFKFRFNLLR